MTVTMPARLRAAIDAFQFYLLKSYKSHGSSWSESRALIQVIATELGVRYLQDHTQCVDLAGIASILRVAVRVTAESEEAARATLCPTSDGFEVRLGRGRSVRQRFALAHEYGHCLFYSLEDRPPRRLVPLGVPKEESWNREEGLCDAFASSLLVPELVGTRILKRKPAVSTVMREAKSLRVSGEVLIRRLLDELNGWPDCVFYRVDFDRQKVSVRVFKGAGVKGRRVGVPSARAVEAAVSRNGRDGCVETLRDLLPGGVYRFGVAERTLWALVDLGVRKSPILAEGA